MPDALRCRGCNERLDATHWSWCEVGTYATAVTRAQCQDDAPPDDPGPQPGFMASVLAADDGPPDPDDPQLGLQL